MKKKNPHKMLEADQEINSNCACLNFEAIVPGRGDLGDLIAGGQVNATVKAVALLCLGVFVVTQRVPRQNKPVFPRLL